MPNRWNIAGEDFSIFNDTVLNFEKTSFLLAAT
jgi:hypothetical protein